MTADNGMDREPGPVGYERTILHLQRRIRLLESMLSMAHQVIQDSPNSCLSRRECEEITRILGHVRIAKRS